MKKKTIKIIEISDVVPQAWIGWFYGTISEDAPFSWGDNNRTLVTAERLHDHCVDRLDFDIDELEEMELNQVDIDNFLRGLEDLGQTYIDLEN
jgi:hypothetical protein